MKVLINAFDSATKKGPFPNLAAMKIASYHKSQGDEVALVGKGLTRQDVMHDPDRVYVSVIFEWNGTQAAGLKAMYPAAEFLVGGSGINLETKLPPAIDLAPPDYSIYDDRGVQGWPYALGFSYRGCNRKCPFCIVPRKEGRITAAGGLELRKIISQSPSDDRLLLLDNNFVQNDTVTEDLKWLSEWNGKVNYSQGIDAREIERNPELAYLLAATNYTTRTFDRRMLTSAYDWPQLSKIVGRAVGHFKEAGINIRNDLQFFVLVNYNTELEQDLERIYHLRELGTNSFVMVFDKQNAPLIYTRLQRWANNRVFYWGQIWEEFRDSHVNDFSEPEIRADGGLEKWMVDI